MQELTIQRPVQLEEMPEYDLFLSQVLEFLSKYFPDEHFTGNIVQNYIKSEIITKPSHGKKRGYTRMHLIQLVFLSYMRPILTADEIRRVFALAFNEINQPEDDIITWEQAYEIFLAIYEETEQDEESSGLWEAAKINEILGNLEVEDKDIQRIRQFVRVLIHITRASNIKRNVRAILAEAGKSVPTLKISGTVPARDRGGR